MYIKSFTKYIFSVFLNGKFRNYIAENLISSLQWLKYKHFGTRTNFLERSFLDHYRYRNPHWHSKTCTRTTISMLDMIIYIFIKMVYSERSFKFSILVTFSKLTKSILFYFQYLFITNYKFFLRHKIESLFESGHEFIS